MNPSLISNYISVIKSTKALIPDFLPEQLGIMAIDLMTYHQKGVITEANLTQLLKDCEEIEKNVDQYYHRIPYFKKLTASMEESKDDSTFAYGNVEKTDIEFRPIHKRVMLAENGTSNHLQFINQAMIAKKNTPLPTEQEKVQKSFNLVKADSETKTRVEKLKEQGFGPGTVISMHDLAYKVKLIKGVISRVIESTKQIPMTTILKEPHLLPRLINPDHSSLINIIFDELINEGFICASQREYKVLLTAALSNTNYTQSSIIWRHQTRNKRSTNKFSLIQFLFDIKNLKVLQPFNQDIIVDIIENRFVDIKHNKFQYVRTSISEFKKAGKAGLNKEISHICDEAKKYLSAERRPTKLNPDTTTD
jgi:hypothetical protein